MLRIKSGFIKNSDEQGEMKLIQGADHTSGFFCMI